MNVLFNPNVIKIKQGYESAGIDFAAYDSTITKWKLEAIACFSDPEPGPYHCAWYNKASTKNTILYTQNSVSSLPYANLNFDCSLSSLSGSNLDNCDNFQGASTHPTLTQGKAGVFAFRHIYFPQGFQSQLYPD
jgi:hypothetical protein